MVSVHGLALTRLGVEQVDPVWLETQAKGFPGPVRYALSEHTNDVLTGKPHQHLGFRASRLDRQNLRWKAVWIQHQMKGFLSLGHEVDSTADPIDLGMAWILSKPKPDHLGKRAVAIRRSSQRVRRELVDLLTEDPARLVVEGAPITPNDARQASEGFVIASVWSVANQRSVALGLLASGRQRLGETVFIRMQNQVVHATVTAPCFHDPSGARLRR